MTPAGKIVIQDGEFVDESGRTVILRGINFCSDSKKPADQEGNTLQTPASYVGRPCSLEDADEHYTRLRKLGFNTLRWVYTWDALQPFHPDQFDEEYIDYVIAMIRKAIDYGFYVFLDPHQDIWSRFNGGSGAPLWTLQAAGLDYRYFDETQASTIWDPDHPSPIKMLWASNYHRLACLTMFTLFFAGEEFAPKCTINGINVGTYLESKFLDALRHFMRRVNAANLGHQFLGWESMNEPGHGLIAYEDLGKHPDALHHVKLGTAPTPFEGFMLGQGLAQRVETWRFTAVGAKRENSVTVIPSRSTWYTPEDLKEIDDKFGWKRSWPGGCIWEFHGVYDSAKCKLLQPNYFRKIPPYGPKLDHFAFVDTYFVRHWEKFVACVDECDPGKFVFMQSPVNVPPPDMSQCNVDLSRTVFTPHYYDGMTLMLKRWRWLNVDGVGVMRDLYSSPIRAVKIGDKSIRKSFVSQLSYLRDEGRKRIGNVAVLMSEIGIPYDMDDKEAYKTGYWDLQVRAMDANSHGLEGSTMSHALWCYCVNNSHYGGDDFAGEDLSIFSRDDFDPNIGDRLPENGIRAAPAVIRPTPNAVAGAIVSYSFDIYKAHFVLTLNSPEGGTTEVFLPFYHFPNGERSQSVVGVSSGKWSRDDQVLKWTHEKGIHTLTVKGKPRFHDSLFSYIDPVQKFFGVVRSGVWIDQITGGEEPCEGISEGVN